MMTLYYNRTSPFARKCWMVVEFASLHDQVELNITNPMADESLRETNPLGKVPALKTPELTLFDSPIICEYLDTLNDTTDLFKRNTPEYFQIQMAHVRANGVLEAAVASLMEKRRETEHSQLWLQRWQSSIEKTIRTQACDHLGSPDDVSIATISMAAALGYLDFRFAELNWREWNEDLAQWFENIAHCPWFIATIPQA